jgi:hypothetical protein
MGGGRRLFVGLLAFAVGFGLMVGAALLYDLLF